MGSNWQVMTGSLLCPVALYAVVLIIALAPGADAANPFAGCRSDYFACRDAKLSNCEAQLSACVDRVLRVSGSQGQPTGLAGLFSGIAVHLQSTCQLITAIGGILTVRTQQIIVVEPPPYCGGGQAQSFNCDSHSCKCACEGTDDCLDLILAGNCTGDIQNPVEDIYTCGWAHAGPNCPTSGGN
jgi:hypothetical protein